MKIAAIKVRDGRRHLRDVSDLAASMDAIGLLQPIIVTEGGALIAGRHRLEAARLLGWTEIDAIVSDLSGHGAELAEIDENLIRHDLTPAERAHYTARRKAVYLAIHPETGHGAVGRGGKKDPKLGSFIDATSDQTGRSRTAIARDAQRGEQIAPDVLEAVQGTERDKGTTLDALARMEPEQQRETISRPHVSHNSGDNEWYTPADIIERARDVLGTIDLDPASSAEANACVRATRYFSQEDDGLSKEWGGRIWLNPPYAKGLIEAFCSKLVESMCTAVVLVNNATETAWGQLLLDNCSAVCFPRHRVKYWAPDKKTSAPLQGQMIVYFGPDTESFKEQFEEIGVIK